MIAKSVHILNIILCVWVLLTFMERGWGVTPTDAMSITQLPSQTLHSLKQQHSSFFSKFSSN